MKKQLFLYLFVFSTLLALFIYVNSKRIVEKLNTKITKQNELIANYKDSIKTLEAKNFELTRFDFDNNEDAISYFERSDIGPEEVDVLVKEKLQELNFYKGDQHPIVPYVPSSENRKILINTIKLLNHKWLIADFSDGVYWGEILVRYFINEDKTVDFELSESFLYH